MGGYSDGANDVGLFSETCYRTDMAKLDPLISEFGSQEEADDYDRWFRAQVEAGLASKGPWIPHEEAMAQIRKTIERASREKH